jgi:flagellar protein FliJ
MVKRFDFKLQGVLDLIKMKEDLLGQDLAKLLRELLAEKNKLDIFKNDYNDTRLRLEEELVENLDLKKISFFNDYLRFIDKEIKNKKKLISLMEEVITIKRKELEKVMKDKNVMDKLKGRKLTEYNSDVLRQEQKVIDEIGTQRFIYKKGVLGNGN